MLQLAVDLAAELVHGCSFADVMFIRAGGVVTPVSSDALAVALDHAQEAFGEGPCLTAARHEPLVVANDLGNDDRWPRFGARASEMGVHAAVSYQLFLHRNDTDRFGALNLYGADARGFDDAAIQLGEVFAAQCAAVLAAAVTQEGAQAALESRDVIGQAKGVLMERHKVSASEAFDMLRRVSQRRNLKVREVAQQVAETGLLP